MARLSCLRKEGHACRMLNKGAQDVRGREDLYGGLDNEWVELLRRESVR